MSIGRIGELKQFVEIIGVKTKSKSLNKLQ